MSVHLGKPSRKILIARKEDVQILLSHLENFNLSNNSLVMDAFLKFLLACQRVFLFSVFGHLLSLLVLITYSEDKKNLKKNLRALFIHYCRFLKFSYDSKSLPEIKAVSL